MQSSYVTQRGQLSLQVLVFTTVAVILLSGFIFLAVSFLHLSTRGLSNTLAFSIAESGVEYYRWHLAHAPDDFQDGTGGPGPYVHPYFNKDGVQIGTFTLEITPVPNTTIVRVRSTGAVTGDSSISRTIEVVFGKPSLARYAVAANASMRFGSGTEVFGEIFSNGGIRFDGVAHNVVGSSMATYDDPDHSGGNEFGVHTHVTPTDPLPPAAVPSRPDVFMSGRQFPLPAIDFAGITQDLADLKAQAQANGLYFASSTAFGYDLRLSSTTYQVYRVTALTPTPSNCSNTQGQSGWGTWSIQSETQVASGTIPTSGVMFFEDNLWVRGGVDGRRITIGSGRFPDSASTRTSITVNADLLYTRYDGSDTIGLIAQNNVNVGMVSDDNLRIDAALVAQNGRIGRYYYQGPGGGYNRCSPYHTRSTLTTYGTLVTNQRYGFAYTDGNGYQTRNLNYDGNLLYGPPPGFPTTSDSYEEISWTEIR